MKKNLLPLLLLIAPFCNKAQPLISFQTIVSGLSDPVDIVEANDSTHQLFIVERTGKIRIWKNSGLLPAAFLNAASFITTSGQEQGLLSLAFHPDYKNNGFFFIYYTNTSGSVTVARYHRSNDSTADASSGVVLLTIPKNYSNHNGGHLLFGKDGYLYFGTGDGGSGGDPDNNAQNGQSLLGKMLRIDVNYATPPYYTIPPTNPFLGSTTTKPEIIATGLRNPWRWSFDKQTGDMWIADVGQDAWEEVNVVPAAGTLNKDYGWSCFEGTHAYKSCAAKANNVVPIFDYSHNSTTGGYSITGGYVYRGTEFTALQGYYICSDYVSGNGWLIKSDGNGWLIKSDGNEGWSTSMQTKWPNLSSFGESLDGTLYAVSLSGTLYKIIASSPLPLHLVSFTGRGTGNKFELKWQVQNETAADIYIIEKRTVQTEAFTEINRTKATSNHSSNSYTVKVSAAEEQTFYRLKIISGSGEIQYSEIINTINKTSPSIKASVTGSSLNVTIPLGTTIIELFDASGKALVKQKINAQERQITISLTNFAKGVISIIASINDEKHSVKFVWQ